VSALLRSQLVRLALTHAYLHRSASLTPVFRFNSASKSPDPNIPASYVGKTPLQLLQPPHKPPTVSSAGVMTFENTVIEPPVHNTTVHVPASLRNYAATAALYKLHGPSSDAPRDLHLLLPRFYRELWGAWAREYEEEKEKEERVRKETTIWVDAVIEEVVDGLVVVEEKVEETADDVDVAAAVDERAPKSGKRSGGAPKPLRATPPEIEKHQAILPCAKVSCDPRHTSARRWLAHHIVHAPLCVALTLPFLRCTTRSFRSASTTS